MLLGNKLSKFDKLSRLRFQSLSILVSYFVQLIAVGRGTLFVCCVRISEVENVFEFYDKVNREHMACPLYRGCPHLRESVCYCNC